VIFNDGSQYRVLTNPDAQLAAGRTLFAYRVASVRNGAPYVDTEFRTHRARTAHKFRATLLYQYVHAALTPESQADFFLNAVGNGLQSPEMVCLDAESAAGFTSTNVPIFAQRWLSRVESALNTRAWLYVPGALAAGLVPLAADRVIWAPHYSAVPTWRHDVHQYTDSGPFPGCAQSGDTSRTSLTAEQLLARCNPTGFSREADH
jgi:GH25 family lysozyme M1 (1,4-beta-N-acetylmuramidase)